MIPAERYVSQEYADLELERLWSRVWQVACREEEVARPGDFVEYRIGDDSVVVTRHADGAVHAFHNTCLHRGTRLVEGCGSAAGDQIRCPYHAWCYALDGRLVDVPDAHQFDLEDGLRLAPVRAERFGGFVFVNLDPAAEPLLDFLDPIPELLAPYHLEDLRFRSYQTTILPANWKAVIDAFNEGYHVQGTHPQILPWTDDTSIAYEQFETHARYGRLEGARRELRGSPRLSGDGDGDEATADEGEILAALVAGLGGAFLGDERQIVAELRAADLPPGELLGAYQRRRMDLLASRGFDTSGFTPERMTSAEDVYWFPNLVGPIYPGSAILFRVRPNGGDPHSSIKDTWVLEWPTSGDEWTMPERRFHPDWQAKDWGPITNQDYANLARVQAGMRSSACTDLRLNPVQESNIAHMHRVIDRYVAG